MDSPTKQINKAFLAMFPNAKTIDIVRASGLSKSTVLRAKRLQYSPAVCEYMATHKPSMIKAIDYANRAYAQRQSSANGRKKKQPNVPDVVILPMGKPTRKAPFCLGMPLHQVRAA